MAKMHQRADADRVQVLRRHVEDTAIDEHTRHANSGDSAEAWRDCPVVGCVAARDVLAETA